MRSVGFIISAAIIVLIVCRVVQFSRTGELELNGRILRWDRGGIERVVFVIAVGAHLLLLWIAIAGIAY